MSPSSTAKSSTAKSSTAKSRTAKSGTPKSGTAKSGAVTVSVVSPSGDSAATVELPAKVFDAKVNVPLMHQVVVAQQAAARQGTHATRTRGAVRGGGKKPYRQKGTGRARQGSVRAPQFTGGGVVHGPVPRSYEQRTPKKMKVAALRGALSDRAAHGRVHVVTGFTDGSEPKTKDALGVLSAVTGVTPALSPLLVVAGTDDVTTRKSLRNVPGVHLLTSGQLNTYDVLVSDHVVFTETALAEFLTRSGVDLPAGLEARTAFAEAADSAAADEAVSAGDKGETDETTDEDETTEPEDEQP
jgi:large subunit ribosomal protein L4